MNADIEHWAVLARQVASLIQRARCDLSTEKRLQADIEAVLTAAKVPFSREHHLSTDDIPDFYVHTGIVVECKVKGARKMDIYRQLCRYAEHESVHALILASNVAMSLPAEINGKPVLMASISSGWL